MIASESPACWNAQDVALVEGKVEKANGHRKDVASGGQCGLPRHPTKIYHYLSYCITPIAFDNTITDRNRTSSASNLPLSLPRSLAIPVILPRSLIRHISSPTLTLLRLLTLQILIIKTRNPRATAPCRLAQYTRHLETFPHHPASSKAWWHRHSASTLACSLGTRLSLRMADVQPVMGWQWYFLFTSFFCQSLT